MDEAETACVDIAFELNKEPDVSVVIEGSRNEKQAQPKERNYKTGLITNRRRRAQPIEIAVNRWLEAEQEKVDAGLMKQASKDRKESIFRLHIIPFLLGKGITLTSDINITTFDDYPIYRSETTTICRKQEIGKFREWCRNYLVKNRLMDSELVMDKSFLPKTIVKQTDLLRNPAITPEDWKIIIDFVRDEWRHRPLYQENQSGWYFRNLFWHYLLFSKNTGMSPEEIHKLRWRQIEIIDEGRINSEGKRVSWEVAYINTIRAKTQQAREVPANQARELRRWKEWLEEYIESNNMKNVEINKNTLVYGDVRRNWTGFSHKHYGEVWRDIREELKDKLTGHRFSPHPYTLYSLRSTFIEDQLMKGTPVMEVAEMAGHDIRETQRTYARLNLRRKGRELTMPELGKKRIERSKVDLFEDDTDE
ncbi:hypothetical protein KR49_06905 [Synechococcus sp. KORDI-49]|nr:hypothetical protein KR49_06905 [Synechococcus sp. KORDI-49]